MLGPRESFSIYPEGLTGSDQFLLPSGDLTGHTQHLVTLVSFGHDEMSTFPRRCYRWMGGEGEGGAFTA